MANYRISPNAKDDLERIWRYGVDRWGMEAADAYQGAEEAFVNDFVVAWAKVMQSDLFDLGAGLGYERGHSSITSGPLRLRD